MRPRWTPRCRRSAGLGLAVLVLAAVWSLRTAWLPWMGHWLDVGQPPRPTDYVLILAGGETTRPFVGGALLRTGCAREALLISAAAGPQEEDGDRPSSGQVARRVLEAMDVAPSRLHELPGRSNSTFGDAQLLRQFLQQHPRARVAIVTNHYHTRRARWIFRRVLGSSFEHVYFVSAPADSFDLDDWWRCKDGCMSCVIEYVKLLIYWYLYGSGVLVSCAVGAALVFAQVRWSRARFGRGEQASSPQRPGPTN